MCIRDSGGAVRQIADGFRPSLFDFQYVLYAPVSYTHLPPGSKKRDAEFCIAFLFAD